MKSLDCCAEKTTQLAHTPLQICTHGLPVSRNRRLRDAAVSFAVRCGSFVCLVATGWASKASSIGIVAAVAGNRNFVYRAPTVDTAPECMVSCLEGHAKGCRPASLLVWLVFMFLFSVVLITTTMIGGIWTASVPAAPQTVSSLSMGPSHRSQHLSALPLGSRGLFGL